MGVVSASRCDTHSRPETVPYLVLVHIIQRPPVLVRERIRPTAEREPAHTNLADSPADERQISRLESTERLRAGRAATDPGRVPIVGNIHIDEPVEVQRDALYRVRVPRVSRVTTSLDGKVASIADENGEDAGYFCGICGLDAAGWTDFLLFGVPDCEVIRRGIVQMGRERRR